MWLFICSQSNEIASFQYGPIENQDYEIKKIKNSEERREIELKLESDSNEMIFFFSNSNSFLILFQFLFNNVDWITKKKQILSLDRHFKLIISNN